jgi:hypothetical protein
MMNRQDLLLAIWKEIINAPLSEAWVGNVIGTPKTHRDGPFADLGPILESMVQKGVSRRELSLLNRYAAYEAVFRLLYMFEDPEYPSGSITVGSPACSGHRHGDLPVGVQAVARNWREYIALAVMAALESHYLQTPLYPRKMPLQRPLVQHTTRICELNFVTNLVTIVP